MSGRGETSSSRWKLEGFFCRWGVRGMSFSARRRPGRLRAACQGSTDDAHWLCREGGIWRASRRGCFSSRLPLLFPSGSSRRGRAAHLSTSCRVSGLRWRREQPFSICSRGQNRRQAHLPHAKGEAFPVPRTADTSGLAGVAGENTCGSAPRIEKPLDKRTIVS